VVNLAPIDIQCGSCGSGKASWGQSYSATEKATGGTGGYKYQVTSGSLPPGLTLNASTGVISGTPRVLLGSYTFTTKVTDSAGNSDTVVCTIEVCWF
jgi:hypothetical protein